MKIIVCSSNVTVAMTPSQAQEMSYWIEDNPATCDDKVSVVGRNLILPKSMVKSIAKALQYDFDLSTGFERPAAQKRSMLRLANKLAQSA